MTAPDHRKAELFAKHLDNELTPEEEQEWQLVMQQSPLTRLLVEELKGPHRLPANAGILEPVDAEEYWARINTLRISQRVTRSRARYSNRVIWMIKAAAVILVVSLLLWLYFQKPKPSATASLPLNWESFILLSDSSKLMIRDLPADTVLAGGLRIHKEDNQLSYSAPVNAEAATLHRLYVERGKHYLLLLPDSSRVSVSDSTAVNFMVPFIQDRTVAVSGQARFKVQEARGRPFRAILVTNALDTHPQKVLEAEALGTSFSIRAYPGEHTQTVKLYDGRLQVQGPLDTLKLYPGEKATRETGSKMKKENFIAASTAADRATGHFFYQDTDIQTIMEDIGRWYDVKVIYTGATRTKKITFSAYSTQSLNEIIKMISRNDIQVFRKGREVHVNVATSS